MIYLVFAILCSVLLGFIFKLYPRFGVDSFQAILFNYVTCVTCATLHLGQFPIEKADFNAPWMPYALGLGLVFIVGFTGAAMTVHYYGVTISQIMQKMSLLISVPFAMLFYQESANWVKVLGIVMALAAIILVNVPSGKNTNGSSAQASRPNWILAVPFVTWILSGVIEVVFLLVQNERYIEFGDVSFIATVFGTAGVFGFSYAAIGWARGRLKFSWRNVLGGIALGIPNYGSILFILQGLGSGLEGSFFFPVCNVGIIVATTLGAVFMFQEHLSRLNWAGIALAIAAIACIST